MSKLKDVLSKSWRLTWNNKKLWFLGFLTTLADPAVGQITEIILPARILIVLTGLIIATIGLAFLSREIVILSVKRKPRSLQPDITSIKTLVTRFLIIEIPLVLIVVGLTLGLDIQTLLESSMSSSIGLVVIVMIATVFLIVAMLITKPLIIISKLIQIIVVVDNANISQSIVSLWKIIRHRFGMIVALYFSMEILPSLALAIIYIPVIFLAPSIQNKSDFVPTVSGVLLFAMKNNALFFYLPIFLICNSIINVWVNAIWILAYQQVNNSFELKEKKR